MISAVPLLLVPLAVLPGALFPYVTGKTILVVLGAQIAVAVALWTPTRRAFRQDTAIERALLAVGGACVLGALLGRDLAHSLWDSPERQLGLVTLAHAGLACAALRAGVRDERGWTRLCATALGAVTLVALLAIAQALWPGLLPDARQGERVASTLGHASYLAAVSLYGLALAGILVSRLTGARRSLAAAGGATALVALILCDTRSATLGLGAGLAAAVLLAAVSGRRPEPQRRLRTAALAFVAAAALVLGIARAGALGQIPGLRRFADAGPATGGHTRLLVWRAALAAFGDAPLLGSGTANFTAALEPHYPAGLVERGFSETWFDDAHNVVLNLLVEQGSVGLLAHLALWAAVAAAVWRGVQGKRRDESVAVGAGFAAVLTHHLFTFESAGSLVLGALLLAFVDRGAPALAPAVAGPRSRWRHLALVAPVPLAVLWVPAAAASFAAAASLRSIERAELDAASRDLDRAAAFAAHANYYHRLVAGRLLQRGPELLASHRPALARLAGHLDASLEADLRAAPDDVRTRLARAQLLRFMATRIGVPGAADQAVLLMREAMTQSPARQEVAYLLAALLLERGVAAEGLDLLRQSIARTPRYGGGWWRLALAHEVLGDIAEAKRVAREARIRGVLLDADGERVLARILAGEVTVARGRGQRPARGSRAAPR